MDVAVVVIGAPLIETLATMAIVKIHCIDMGACYRVGGVVVNSLTAMVAYMRPLIFELRSKCRVETRLILVHF